MILVDYSEGWATPWGSAIEEQCAQPERKSTTRYVQNQKGDNDTIINRGKWHCVKVKWLKLIMNY